jgi:hypothetical protein
MSEKDVASRPRGAYMENESGELKAHPGRGGQNWSIEPPAHDNPNHPRGGGEPQGQNEQDNSPASRPRGAYTGQESGELREHSGRGGTHLYIEPPVHDNPNHPRGSGGPQSQSEQGLSTDQLAVVAARINEVAATQPLDPGMSA